MSILSAKNKFATSRVSSVLDYCVFGSADFVPSHFVGSRALFILPKTSLNPRQTEIILVPLGNLRLLLKYIDKKLNSLQKLHVGLLYINNIRQNSNEV